MDLSLHVVNFTYAGGPRTLAEDLGRIARTAEDAGFYGISVMDHLWQIGVVGPKELDMLEAYTTLGYLAAQTSRVKLLTLVTGVTYREPGLLAKQVATLDVLSGGRAMLGIGAAWNEEESRGLGLFFPPTAERFERLEETLQICRQMWSDDDGPYRGKHYTLESTLCVPQPLQTKVPIMVGGSGERKTLRLVAQYADMCNIFGGPEAGRKLDVLRQRCEEVGRDYDEITKTTLVRAHSVDQMLTDLRHHHELGYTIAEVTVPDVSQMLPMLEQIGDKVIPEIRSW